MTTNDSMTDFQQRACAVALIKMLSGKHFSICDLDAIAKTMGKEAAMAGKDYAALRALHCVDWADMGTDLTTMVHEKCFELLGLPQAAIPSVCKRAPAAEETANPGNRPRLAFWKR